MDSGIVDAIEDGRIVRVSSEYAKREGLLVIRSHEKSVSDSPKVQNEMKLTPRLRGEKKAFFDIDKYRRPWHDKNDILSSLIDNFHWEISARRKQLNISRKQVAQAINVSEEDLKMLENGNLPHSDYILINKLENYLKINLRKDKSVGGVLPDVGAGSRSISKPKWAERMESKKQEATDEDIVSNEIEIIDDSDEGAK